MLGDILISAVVKCNQNVQQQYNNDESEDVVENQSERRGKVVESTKLGTAHDGVDHGLNDEIGSIQFLIFLIQTDKGLQETDTNEEQESKEDERFLHHDLKHDQHGSEKAEGVKVEKQTAPEHRCGEGEEVVTELIELVSVRVSDVVAKSDHSRDERHGQKGVKSVVEGVPETKVVFADLPELCNLVAEEAKSKNVEQAFDDIEITSRVDGVDGASVETEVEDTDEDLKSILI